MSMENPEGVKVGNDPCRDENEKFIQIDFMRVGSITKRSRI